MPIGVICAIPQELTHLLDLLDTPRRVQTAGTEFASGLIDGVPVVLAGAGMGKVNAALVTTLLVDRFGCSSVVFSGVAGGLDPGLAIGDIVIADRVVQIDAGTITGERLSVYQAGHVESINPPTNSGYRVAPELMERVRITFSGFVLPGRPGWCTGWCSPVISICTARSPGAPLPRTRWSGHRDGRWRGSAGVRTFLGAVVDRAGIVGSGRK